MKLDFEYGHGLMSANLPDNTDKGVYIIVSAYINLNLNRTLFVRFFYTKFLQ